MTLVEFNQFKTAYFAAFPSTREWLSRVCTEGGIDIKAATASWYRTLQRTELADAMAVLGKLELGELEPVPAYDRDKTALHIRSYAGRIADARRKQTENDRLIQQGTRGNRDDGRVSLGGLYRQIIALSDEALKIFPEEKELPPAERHKVNEWAAARVDWGGLKEARQP
jgi:hypothetical protein